MRARDFYLGCTILITGCYSPGQPTVKILEPLALPKSSVYLDPVNTFNKTNLSNYRDAILGYQRYLSDYISTFETMYNLVPYNRQDLPKPPCPISDTSFTLTVSKAPDIGSEALPEEINIILMRYIKTLRVEIRVHNQKVAEQKALVRRICG